MTPCSKHKAEPLELEIGNRKRLMLVAGRAHPELAARIADKLGVALTPTTNKDVLERRGLLPVRRIGQGR